MSGKKIAKLKLLGVLNQKRLRGTTSGRKIKVVNLNQRAVINTEVQAGRRAPLVVYCVSSTTTSE